MALNPVTQSKIEWLMKTRQAQYDRVVELRAYDRGDTPAQLSDDQKIQIVGEDSAGNPNSDPEVRLNVCAPANAVEANRLDVQDIQITAEGDEEKSQALSKLAWAWWKRNRLDEGQQHAHYSGCRDGDSFGINWYDKEQSFPRVAIHQVYDGQTSGADKFYVDGDPTMPESAVKIWVAKEDENKVIRRKNIYYVDRVEKWICDGIAGSSFIDANWQPLKFGDEDFTDDLQEVESLSQPGKMVTVEWWTESGRDNSPGMGIPVQHFRHDARGLDHGTSTIDLIVPSQQNAVNRAENNLQAGAVLAGFPMNYIIGADRDDTSYTVEPSGLIIVEESDGSAGQFAAANLEQLINVKDSKVKDCATLTSTPLTYFNLTGVIPAEGTQQSLESALIAKVETDQVTFGNTWEDVFRMMLKMEFVWGTALAGIISSHEEIDALDINCVWASAKVRNEKEETEIAQMHKDLGVTQRFVLRMLEYTEDEIDQMMTEKGVKRNAVLGSLGTRVDEIEAQNEAGTVTVQAGTNGTEQTADQPTA
jgi:hypothetical protein